MITLMRGSLDVRQNHDGVLSQYVTSLYSKVRSPPYCCAVPVDPRLNATYRVFK